MPNTNRREFLKKLTASTAGLVAGSSIMGMSKRSYGRIIGANDRLNVGIIGCGRRVKSYAAAISKNKNNVELLYFCDVKKSQLDSAAKKYSKFIDYNPKRETDLRKVIEDPKVDAIFNATPDHWHTPGAIMAVAGDKHVYLEKPLSHNQQENELIIAAEKKYNKVIQVGTQQRSSDHTIEIIKDIHNGIIGTPYKAIAWYSNDRGVVPVQKKVPVYDDLDWDLFQGPAPRRDYTEETWNYNWHWYGWDYGTAETGNNGTHEFDVARWALQVKYPIHVDVDGQKRHFVDDGWEMYDTMDATFKYAGNKTIKWDGKSRNRYYTYGTSRGTIIYGTKGSVFVNRNEYKLFDRSGNVTRDSQSITQEAGTALGGGGGMSTAHVENFFNAIRGKAKLTAPLSEGVLSMAMVNYSNIAYRIGKGFDIDDATGKIYDRDAMELWGRTYELGWEPKV
jgi:predicted dehydrogenase